MTPAAVTAGQALTAALRRYFSLGTRTRRYRGDRDLHAAMTEAIAYAAQHDQFYAPATQQALEGTAAVAYAYSKHIAGGRADPVLIARVNGMTAWQFAGLLGDMAAAGVTNNGEGERYFAQMAKAGGRA